MARKKIAFATGNQGKLIEIRKLCEPLQMDIVSQAELQIVPAVETATTFIENALIKARHVAVQSGLPALADDSGLVVDYLQGAPGVYSARFAGENATDDDNAKKLLFELQGVPDKQRTARYYCTIVYLQHPEDPMPIVCQGVWEGQILLQPQGEQGFGYDPVFYVPTHDCSAAELLLEQKNQLSHRGQAMRELLKNIVYDSQREQDS